MSTCRQREYRLLECSSAPRRIAVAIVMWLGLALTDACARPGPPDARITPLDPQALAHADAGPRAPLPPSAPPITRYLLRPTSTTTDLAPLARALDRRARGLGAVQVQADVRPDGVIELRVALPLRAFASLFGDQVKRRGLLSVTAFDPQCDPFAGVIPPMGVRRMYGRVDWVQQSFAYLYAAPVHSVGAAPLAPLQRFIDSVPTPRDHAVLIGAVREADGDVARRTYCVDTRGALFGPHVRETESTLDATTLYPVLRIHLDPPDGARLEALRQSSRGGLVIAIDDEVIGLTDGTSPRGPDWIQVQPASPIPSVSPEMVSALLAGGALPGPVEMVSGR